MFRIRPLIERVRDRLVCFWSEEALSAACDEELVAVAAAVAVGLDEEDSVTSMDEADEAESLNEVQGDELVEDEEEEELEEDDEEAEAAEELEGEADERLRRGVVEASIVVVAIFLVVFGDFVVIRLVSLIFSFSFSLNFLELV